jgi:hypothetical protein
VEDFFKLVGSELFDEGGVFKGLCNGVPRGSISFQLHNDDIALSIEGQKVNETAQVRADLPADD